MDELKGCPFCGSDEVSLWYQGGRYGRYTFAECDVCGARSKTFRYYDTGEDYCSDDPGAMKARAAWNRRV